MKAHLKNYRQAVRKVRLLATTLKGRRVSDILAELPFVAKKAAEPLYKLVASAFANVKQTNQSARPEDFVVASVIVGKGMVFTRYRAQARGRAAPITRESSHVTVTLQEAAPARASRKKAKAVKAVNASA